MADPIITVFLADDSLLVREGVRALLNLQPDLEVIGVAEDFDGVLKGTEATEPNVLVTDIRMPPSFQNEGIEAARLVRLRNPGIGVVVLSQFDEPEYAIALLRDGPGSPTSPTGASTVSGARPTKRCRRSARACHARSRSTS